MFILSTTPPPHCTGMSSKQALLGSAVKWLEWGSVDKDVCGLGDISEAFRFGFELVEQVDNE